MIRRLKLARARMTSEQEILFNRLLLGTPSGIFGYFLGADSFVMAAFIVYLSVNISLLAMRNYGIGRQKYRLLAGLSMDMIMVGTLMKYDAATMAVFYPMMLWVILGHGFRFGVGWLACATLAACIAFGTAVFSTEYWAQHSILGYSLLITLIIIPAYCSTLIEKLSAAKEQAEVANAAKSHFLASISHELRTPLNAIIGYGNLLKESQLAHSQKKMVEASILAGEHLLHLFDQLIEVSRSDNSQAKHKSSDFRPSELLSEVREIMRVRAQDKGLYLKLQAAPMSDRLLHGPAETIRNILMNLISNAIKFTEYGGISVTLRLVEKEGSTYLEFDVADSGIGIAPDAQQHIFNAFQQADETVLNRFGGTGLGLAICSDLLEQISGHISVSSELGKGSCFSVSLPLEIAGKDAPAGDISADGDAGNHPNIRIISFGEFGDKTLSKIQDMTEIEAEHIACADKDALAEALENSDLHAFDLALVDQRLVAEAGSDHPIWQYFSNEMLVPVLVQHDADIDFEDISLRAAFASIIPPDAGFDEMRSAIRIGCSFARGKVPEADIEPGDIQTPKTTARSILVADDNRTNLNILHTILSAAGHKITMVEDGDEALNALENEKFDLMLLDVNMPRLNGLETCRMWRQIEGGRSRLPIIGVTADATDKTRQSCLNVGMDLRITKPIDAKALLNVIAEICPDETLAQADETLPAGDMHGAPSDVRPAQVNDAQAISPAIDPKQLEYLSSIGDEDFLRLMLDGYNEDIERSRPKFRQSVEDRDVDQFRFYAHAFKSSANNMGAKHLAQLCGRLEFISESDFLQDATALLKQVESEIDLATEALENYLAQQELSAKTG